MGYVGNEPSVNFTSFAKQDITGDGGANYTLTHAVANANEIEVFVNNVRQEPTDAYSVSGTALTMTGNVASSDNFYVIYLGKAIQTTVPPDSSVSTAKIADSAVTNAKINNSTIDLTSKVTGVLPVANSQTNTPAFEATRATSDQSITDNTYVKLQYNSEVFDTDSKYDHSTNYRFTPTVAGKYYVYASATLSPQNQTDWNYGNIAIYKNGSEYRNAMFDARGNKVFRPLMNISAVIDFNTTDYVEIYARVVSGDGGTSIMQLAQNNNIFGAYKLIGA